MGAPWNGTHGRARPPGRRGTRVAVSAAAALGLALAGCGGPTTTPSGTSDGASVGADPQDTADSASGLFPPGRLPTPAELDDAVSAAHQAYLGHRAAYDEAARTGFADEELVAALVATTGHDLRDAVIEAGMTFVQDGLVIDGGSEVLGARAAWLHVPADDGDPLSVTFEVCVVLHGALLDSDGAVIEDLSAPGKALLAVEVAEEDGTWVVWSQQEQPEQCPETLGG